MFCSKCGTQIDDSASFCPACGTPIGAANYAAYQSTYAPQPIVPEQPMKWFKFLIYFGLFFGALINLSSGMQMLTGNVYGENKELVYMLIPDLKMLDMIVGVAMIVLAAVGVFARFRLSGYYKNGPMFLYLTYLGASVVNVVYIIGSFVILPSEVAELVNMTSLVSSAVSSGVMIFVNKSYFDKRKHLFINE